MPIGPQLPQTVGKRKRDDDGSDRDSNSSDDIGPSPPEAEPTSNNAAKKSRVMGPSLPPSKQEAPTKVLSANSGTDSSDDDDFGPSLPTAEDKSAGQHNGNVNVTPHQSGPAAPGRATRDEWMTLAPSSGDWSQRVDPTKLKNRKFNSGMSAAASRSGSDAWHETPEQKQARLQREVLGVKDAKGSPVLKSAPRATERDDKTTKRIDEYNKQRGPSLYDAHQKGQKAEAEDDPSARAFNREKDIGGGLQINATKRRDMLKKSADFDSRFNRARQH